MTFYADLHVHSRFSRATSRDGTLEQLALWARRKGVSVVGTGDFAHPAWMSEIGARLVEAEPGLFRLRDDLWRPLEAGLPAACRGPARFVLQVEIATIYKKDGRTRKVHHVVCVPDLESARRLTDRLARVGNLKADGRPILGLDSRDLLEIVLESGEGSFLIPAHIWTPWFSALGSNSGFDSIADCYGDLAEHVFAVETGLSSDPPMNWRLSSLDRYRLVSNSDAHSPAKLGREACVFRTAIDYHGMRRALETGRGFGGTIEFFPEEGKYHLDGHRKCGVCLPPEQTRELGGACPSCGRPLTVGVMHRVHELADRAEPARPKGAPGFRSLIPLAELLSEILGVGPGSARVSAAYDALLERIGPELFILDQAPPDRVSRGGSAALAEAVVRMRAGRVLRRPGYDGEYGVIRVFEERELASTQGGAALFQMPAPSSTPRRAAPAAARSARAPVPAVAAPAVRETPTPCPVAGPGLFGVLGALDPDQRAAASIVDGPLLIVAGPGTGKTRTLTHRIAHLVADWGARPEECLAVTFTRRAAGEMRERLRRLIPAQAEAVPVMTFHALGLALLRGHGARIGLPPDFRVADAAQPAPGGTTLRYDDLIALPVRLLESCPDVAEAVRSRYRWISVDEYQDLDERQYRLVRLMAPPNGNLCVIGDPDQAIYGFRGGDVSFFQRFAADFPSARVVTLTRNYRSSRAIVGAATQAIAPATLLPGRGLQAVWEGPERVVVHAAATDRAEAQFVVSAVERLIGGAAFFYMDSGRREPRGAEALGFSDFAVLYRTDAQADVLAEAFARSGMPFQKRSHALLGDMPCVRALLAALAGTPRDRPLAARLDLAEEGIGGFPADDTRQALRALQALAARAGDMEGFLTDLALGVDADFWDPRADAVSLLTLHSAKGLEFPVVFMTGCEDGVLPLRWGGGADVDVAEERRLMFVGMTRARERLFLSHARKRLWRGRLAQMRPSPFLADIERRLVERSATPARRPKPRAAEQLTLL